MTNKFFIYARKSTDVEDKQILSIEAQLNELREFSKRDGLEVVEELVEKQSAKIPGRPIFSKMLDEIEKGRADGIISWHPDRLARNSVDGGRIIYLLDTGKLSALKFNTFWFESTPQGKFMLSIAFSQSKYYVDSLSENTRRGLRQKAKNGYMPSVAPIGYINDVRNKSVVLSKKLAPIISEAFEKYSVGDITMKDISRFLATKGILNPHKKPFDLNRVKRFLTNPYYCGFFVYSGEVYEGRHEKVISKSLFDKVQDVVSQRNHQWINAKVDRLSKPFLGLLKCGECGMSITADFKVKHYKNGLCGYFNYYRCTKKNKHVKCSQSNVRDIDLESQLTTLIKKYSLRSDWAINMQKELDKEQKGSAQSVLDVVSLKRKQIDNLNIKLQLLLDTYLDQIIDKESYKLKKLELFSQKKTLEEQIVNLQNHQGNWIEPMKNWIIEANGVDQIVSTNNKEQIKVLAAKIFGSNLYLKDKTVRGIGQNAWSALGADPTGRTWVPSLGFEPRKPYGNCSTGSRICPLY